MSKRPLILVAALVVLAGGWYAFRPERAFIDETVNESLPEVAAAPASDTAAAMAPMAPATMASDTAMAMPDPVATGQFHSNAHETKGTATIHALADGRRVLRLTSFSTSNGPDVRVYLVAAEDVTDNETVKRAGYVELGKLKGNIGDQNYEIPASVDLTKYRTVTVWCARFSVNFGSAPLA